VISKLHINRDVRSQVILLGRNKIIVTIKLMDLAIEDTPATCNDKMTKSIEQVSK
jgi:hypothetical protein